jgi:Domain of unknown function (DUF4062)
MAIQTPDQRLRVFVSSTMNELAAERVAVKAAVERLRLTPVLFELGARPHPPRDLYLAYVRQSHVFIGIYWEQYGWVAPGQQLSGLEDEYTAAVDRPKLVYLKEPAHGRQPRLAEMLERISSDGLSYRRFSTPEELAALVADDLAVLLSERFGAAAGSVHGSEEVRHRPVVPTPVSRFIGRTRERAELEALLTDARPRLVTLVGPGGIGKTRLALQAEKASAAADDLREDFPEVYRQLAPKDLHMLWFLIKPHVPEILAQVRATVEEYIDRRRPDGRVLINAGDGEDRMPIRSGPDRTPIRSGGSAPRRIPIRSGGG